MAKSLRVGYDNTRELYGEDRKLFFGSGGGHENSSSTVKNLDTLLRQSNKDALQSSTDKKRHQTFVDVSRWDVEDVRLWAFENGFQSIQGNAKQTNYELTQSI
jgi:hypothetical protein